MRVHSSDSNNVLDFGFNPINVKKPSTRIGDDNATPYITVEIFDNNNEMWKKVAFDKIGETEIRFSEFISIDLQHQQEDSILTFVVPYSIEGGSGTELGDFLFNRDFKNDWTNIIIDGTTFECYSKEYKYSSDDKGQLTVKAYAEEWQLNTFAVATGVKKFKGKSEGTYGYTEKFIMTNKSVHEVLNRLYRDSIFKKRKPPIPKSSLDFEYDEINQPVGYGELKLLFDDYDSNDLELNIQNLKGVLDHMNKVHSTYHKPYIITNSLGLKDIVFYEQQEWDQSIVRGVDDVQRSLKYNVEFLNNRTTLTGDRRYVNEYKKGFLFAPRTIEEVVVKESLAGEDDGEEATIDEENRKAENYPVLDRLSVGEVSFSNFFNIRIGDKFGEQVIISKKLTYDSGSLKCSIAFDQNEGLDGGGLNVDGSDELDIDYDGCMLYYGLETIASNVIEGAKLSPNTQIGTTNVDEYFIIQSQYNQYTVDLYERNASGIDSIGVTHNPTIDFERTGDVEGTIILRYRAISEEYGFSATFPNIGVLMRNTSVKTPSNANSHIVTSGNNEIFGNYVLIKFREE